MKNTSRDRDVIEAPGFVPAALRVQVAGDDQPALMHRDPHEAIRHRLVIAARAHDSMLRHLQRDGPRPLGGLLVGVRREDGCVHATRALPCPNLAPWTGGRRGFETDPRILLNVRGALAASTDEIVGVYTAGGGALAIPAASELAFARPWAELVWLGSGGEVGTETYRAWALAGVASSATETVLDVQLPAAAHFAGCAEQDGRLP